MTKDYCLRIRIHQPSIHLFIHLSIVLQTPIYYQIYTHACICEHIIFPPISPTMTTTKTNRNFGNNSNNNSYSSNNLQFSSYSTILKWQLTKPENFDLLQHPTHNCIWRIRTLWCKFHIYVCVALATAAQSPLWWVNPVTFYGSV